ncbi:MULTISPECIES: PAS domain S-box protein [unclassified Pseudodesulfovibrio]|uniref:PAS domain-containing sensor histidine kinase n=1 Tax=unclassified Pseudodesulfovibrio TaxID=2661612 RepID=UPI000FEBE647|nr:MULTISPECIES: PAS domain S-box protein [unclassified Pseudodesulfovibrio]MCJ2164768.1 PAS domain S-box protein [Pseudodesulfovibrio sp. S3-i]RWU04046.1 PAS domain-containing sensor histidine kinase [Pseudodesulfovibrio sp. S3]
MLKQKHRFVMLAILMAMLVGIISMFSTWLLYRTSLEEQRKRLNEIVQSQASLIFELRTVAHEGATGTDDIDDVLNHLVRAYRRIQTDSSSGDFTVAERNGSSIRFLVVNGEKVPLFSPLANVPMDSAVAVPMQQALLGKSGTIIAPDYQGVEVLAAFTPLEGVAGAQGLVAKINIDEIKGPFFQANFSIFGLGLLLTLLGVGLFFKLSEPIIQELKTSAEKYRDLVEGANTLILRIGADGLVTFANSYAQKYLGSEECQPEGADAMLVLSGTSSSEEESSLEQVLEFFGTGEGPYELPLPIVDGRVQWISWTVKKKEAGGSLKELLCIGNDVTARHLAKEAQQEIEERFRGITKASPVGIVIVDMGGNLLYANERMHELTHCGAAQLAGRGWLSRIHQSDRDFLVEQWFGSSTVVTDRLEFRLASEGDDIWTLGQIVDLKSRDAMVIGHVITFTDITKIKLAESEHKRLTAAIDQAAEAIIITDPSGTITYVNPAFERITGYHRREAIGKNPRILKSGEQGTEFYDDLWNTLLSGNIWHGQYVNKKKNGERYTQEATIGPVRDRQGEIISYVGVARDISRQLVTEAQLRQAQKLESIGELAAGIAHEINTPTQYVITNTHFLGESFATLFGLLEQYAGLVEAIRQGVGHKELLERAETFLDDKELQYLAQDIPQAISESEVGLKRIAEIVLSVKQLAHPGEVAKSLHDLNEIVQNAATVSSNEWKYVAEMEMDLSSDLKPVNCLKGEVGQVVLNLIINGAHAIVGKLGPKSEEKGVLKLRTYAEGNMAVLEVSDTGTGMSKAVLKRAFDPFFTTKEVGKGTGQGLAITHNVVANMHGGTIDVLTEEGKGSTFIIKLPFQG